MSLTNEQARDEILALVTTVWEANTSGEPLFYGDLPGRPPEGLWAFADVELVASRDGALVGGLSGSQHRYESVGLVTIQIHTNTGSGLSLVDVKSNLVQNGLRGAKTPGGVWFRNVRVFDVGRNARTRQQDVVADFLFDELI